MGLQLGTGQVWSGSLQRTPTWRGKYSGAGVGWDWAEELGPGLKAFQNVDPTCHHASVVDKVAAECTGRKVLSRARLGFLEEVRLKWL